MTGPCTRMGKTALPRPYLAGPGGAAPFFDRAGRLRLAYHAWRTGRVGYPSTDGCRETNAGCPQRRLYIATLAAGKQRPARRTPPVLSGATPGLALRGDLPDSLRRRRARAHRCSASTWCGSCSRSPAGLASTGVPDEWLALTVPGQFQTRYYTVRSLADGLLTLDVVVHEEGLVTEWAQTDCVGDVVGSRRRRVPSNCRPTRGGWCSPGT